MVSSSESVSQMCHAFAEPGGHRRTPEDTTAAETEYRRTLEDTTYAGFGTVRPRGQIPGPRLVFEFPPVIEVNMTPSMYYCSSSAAVLSNGVVRQSVDNWYFTPSRASAPGVAARDLDRRSQHAAAPMNGPTRSSVLGDWRVDRVGAQVLDPAKGTVRPHRSRAVGLTAKLRTTTPKPTAWGRF